ncbi:MAG: hypothetical protein K2X27_16220, partial [Candidatus Obscuribacterales bacterium]|nr:hypothetical protein [Candidatus Obscuribacterales bacterium]
MMSFDNVAASVAHCRGLFTNASQSRMVLPTIKQYYAVKIRRVTSEEEKVPTKENPEGQKAASLGEFE